MVRNETVLNNQTRRMIYNHIMAHPGVSFNILKQVFNLNESTLRYHLKYLERNEKISFGLDYGKRLYYPHRDNGHLLQPSDNSNKLETYNLTRVQEQLITTIKRYPGITQKDLITRTGIKRLTVIKNLDKLRLQCMVRRFPNGNRVCYEFIENEQLRYEILKQLVIKLLRKEIDEQRFLELKRKLD
jgi:predicted transcriptional regulator